VLDHPIVESLCHSALPLALWGARQLSGRWTSCEERCSCGAAGPNAGPGPSEKPRTGTAPWRKPPPIPAEAIAAWQQFLGVENFLTDADSLEEYTALQPNGSYYPEPPAPQVVARPRNTEEVAQVLRIANQYSLPVVTYGGGTSLEGHTVFCHGGLCLDLRNLDQVLKLHEEDFEVTLQAAVDWQALNESLAPKGLMLGVDPGPGAHIGGMVSTNCSGPHAFRWGMMRQSVVNVTVVLADGTVVRTRQRPKKTSAGYDLTGLMVGAEGTLGVVTEATLRLQKIPAALEVARVCFPTVRSAAEAVRELKQAGLTGLLCCEFLAAQTVRCVNAFSGTTLEETPMLLLKFGGNSSATVASEIDAARLCCAKHTQAAFQFSRSAEERETLWQARKSAGWAIAAFSPERRLSVTDTAVPLSRIADYIEKVEAEIARSWLAERAGPNALLAHLGDGNVHCNFPYNPDDTEELEEARRLNSFVVMLALDMEGTCTGEHGVGLGKKGYLVKELGPGAVEVMRLVKQALDPKGILNPGKVLPDKLVE